VFPLLWSYIDRPTVIIPTKHSSNVVPSEGYVIGVRLSWSMNFLANLVIRVLGAIMKLAVQALGNAKNYYFFHKMVVYLLFQGIL
jgi:hypothetical protein